MADTSASQPCLDAAYRYLSYRPRSEGEVRQRLFQHGFVSEEVERAIAKLKEQKLIDDFAFARFWKDSRLSFRPKSKRLIARELRNKRVAADIVDEITKDIDDELNAYTIGCTRMRFLADLDYPRFRQRLSGYLSYRGFSHQVIRDTASRLWRERKTK
ncbi:MAG: regulatory protein RecX [Dehalococcoidia bacterium]|nr:MAG: regulatory protein RecX [Dehalococcoidia bacterium]